MRVWIPCLLFVLLLTPVASAEIVILDLGHTPPPAMVGPYPMTPAESGFQAALPDGEQVQGEIAGFGPAGFLRFRPTNPTKLTVPDTWAAWGHGYRGPVFLLGDGMHHLMELRNRVVAFYFYLRPRSGSATIEVSIGSRSTGPLTLQASDGARGFAIYATEGSVFSEAQVSVIESTSGVGVGEFGSADRSSACSFVPLALGQTAHGTWTSECGAFGDQFRNAQYFTFELAEPTIVGVELDGHSTSEILLFEGVGATGNLVGRAFPGEPRVDIELEAGAYTIVVTIDSGQGDDIPFTLRLRELAGLCQYTSTTLCADDREGDQRFSIRVDYRSLSAGQSGAAKLADSQFARGGIFYFFNRSNPEVMVKVLNGCGVNGHFWVFVSAVTNVGFTVTVEDTVNGKVWTHDNPDQNVALPKQDVRAFACDAVGR